MYIPGLSIEQTAEIESRIGDNINDWNGSILNIEGVNKIEKFIKEIARICQQQPKN